MQLSNPLPNGNLGIFSAKSVDSDTGPPAISLGWPRAGSGISGIKKHQILGKDSHCRIAASQVSAGLRAAFVELV